MFLDPLRAPSPDKARLPRIACMALAVCFPLLPATAQTVTPSSTSASSPSAEMTPAERAKRDAENVFRWITIHADKPRKADKPPAKEEKPPTVVRVKAPAAAPVAAAPAPTPSSATAAAPIVATSSAATKPEATTLPAATPASTPPAAELVAQRAAVSAPSAAVGNALPTAAAVEEEAADTLTPLAQAEPKFPIALVRSLRTGQVQVRFTVLTDGSVSEATVVNSTHARLNPAALAAVAQWRFAPVHKPQQGVVDLGFNSGD